MTRKGRMTELRMNSIKLNEKKIVKIYEPETIQPFSKSNICIMQDGDDYFNIGRIATLSDEFHEEQTITNTYFVGIHYEDRYDRINKYHPDGEQYEAYLQFLVKEVLPTLEEKLPSNPLGTSYALMGDSLAATFALTAGVTYPNIFKTIILQSPLVDETVINKVKMADDLSTLQLYHTVGQKETDVPTTKFGKLDFITPNRMLKEILTKKTNFYTYQEFEKGDHTWKHWQKDLRNILPLLFG